MAHSPRTAFVFSYIHKAFPILPSNLTYAEEQLLTHFLIQFPKQPDYS